MRSPHLYFDRSSGPPRHGARTNRPSSPHPQRSPHILHSGGRRERRPAIGRRRHLPMQGGRFDRRLDRGDDREVGVAAEAACGGGGAGGGGYSGAR